MYQKDLNMSYLLDFYGEAIPPKHKEIMTQYYDEDLSLSEIAENFGISRQGARHLIKKGEEQLLFLEQKLGLAQKHKSATQNYAEFAADIERLGDAVEQMGSQQLTELYYRVLSSSQKLRLD